MKFGPGKPVSIQWLPLVWSPEPWFTVRMTASLSACRAVFEHNSVNSIPGTLVWIGL